MRRTDLVCEYCMCISKLVTSGTFQETNVNELMQHGQGAELQVEDLCTNDVRAVSGSVGRVRNRG